MNGTLAKGISKFIIQVAVVALLVGFGHSYANVNSTVLDINIPKSEPVDDCIRSYQDFLENDWKRKACVGAAFVIVKGDDIMLLTGMGEKNRKTHEPVGANSVFRVGSLSKGFASILAGSLVEQEYFDWDDKVTDYVPELAMCTQDATQKLCVENILSHSTGLPRHAYTNLIEDGLSVERIAGEFRTVPLVGEMGKSYAYQNAAYALIEEVIESSTGDTYEDLMRSLLFEPLGMESASMTYDDMVGRDDIARPHNYNATPMRVSKRYYNSVASGGINASITDMAQWMKMLLGNNPEVMDKEALDEVFSPRVNTRRDWRYYNRWQGFKDSEYALGWRVLDLGDRTLIHHGGYVNGYRSEIAIDRENNIAICALFNSPCTYAKQVVPAFFEYYDACHSSSGTKSVNP